MSEPRPTTEVAAEIEAYRRTLAATLCRRSRRRVDGVEVVIAVVPTGLHADLWRLGALVAPGRVALVWLAPS